MKHAADSRLFLFLKCKASFCNSVILPWEINDWSLRKWNTELATNILF
jgi:hypothetical protein